jgi:nucleotidyltransferase/DNA polymerase involved in DNA repair
MGFMERFGYVKKGSYEKVLRERDRLKRSIGELEDKITVLEADKNRLKKRVEFLKMAVPTITKIKNIGPKTAQRLEEGGIKNIIDLIEASPEKITEATGLPKEKALKLIKKATNLIKKQA